MQQSNKHPINTESVVLDLKVIEGKIPNQFLLILVGGVETNLLEGGTVSRSFDGISVTVSTSSSLRDVTVRDVNLVINRALFPEQKLTLALRVPDTPRAHLQSAVS